MLNPFIGGRVDSELAEMMEESVAAPGGTVAYPALMVEVDGARDAAFYALRRIGLPASAAENVAERTTDGGVAFYGTLEGYLKAVSTQDGHDLWKFKMPSGIIGNVFTYQFGGRQYVGVYSGIGGWAGIGMAAGLTEDTAGLGAVGGYKDLAKFTNLGGTLFVFALPEGA